MFYPHFIMSYLLAALPLFPVGICCKKRKKEKGKKVIKYKECNNGIFPRLDGGINNLTNKREREKNKGNCGLSFDTLCIECE